MYQVDAFTDKVFHGNPAAVITLDEWLPEETLQNIATENNLSETAFIVPISDEKYQIRWFTPEYEAPLCGHATLATGYVVFNEIHPTLESVRFDSMSGELGVKKQGDLLVLDFPVMPRESCEAPIELIEGLKNEPIEVFKTPLDPNYYAVYETEDEILQIQPDLMTLTKLHPYCVVVTAPSDKSDFVVRYFAPSYGIPEDPVTGSIHCALVPYWSERLNNTKLFSRQVSRRGGELMCELLGDRVSIGGKAVKFFEGDIQV